jgi:hypothetical protein
LPAPKAYRFWVHGLVVMPRSDSAPLYMSRDRNRPASGL